MARAEIALVSAKGKVQNINMELARVTPGRTAEAIKKVRQRANYKELLNSSRTPLLRTHDGQSEESASPDLATGTQDGRVEGACAPEAQAIRMHGGDSPEAQASLGTAPSVPSNITLEQLPPLLEETGALGSQDTDSGAVRVVGGLTEGPGGSSIRLR